MFGLSSLFSRINSFEKLSILRVAKMMISTNVSSRIQLTILGNGALFQPSVIVTTEKINYLFNCGEGTQRMIIEHNK